MKDKSRNVKNIGKQMKENQPLKSGDPFDIRQLIFDELVK